MSVYTPQAMSVLGWDLFRIKAGVKGDYVDYWVNGHRHDNGRCTSPETHGWKRLTGEQIFDYWPDGSVSRYNIGVATGARSGFFVVDVDMQGTAAEAVAWVKHHLGIDLTRTLMVRTATGGWHFYYLMPEGRTVRTGKGLTREGTFSDQSGTHIDIRADGGMVVGIGSYRKDEKIPEGGYYTAEYDFPVAEAPEALLALLPEVAVRNRGEVVEVEKTTTVAGTLEQRKVGELILELDALTQLAEGDRLTRANGTQVGWDEGNFKIAMDLVRVANSPSAALTLEQAQQTFFAHAPDYNLFHNWNRAVEAMAGEVDDFIESSNVSFDWFDAIPKAQASASPEVAEAVGDLVSIRPPHRWGLKIERMQKSSAPHDLANQIVRSIPAYDGVRVVCHHQGCWYFWTGSYWAETPDTSMFDMIRVAIEDVCVSEEQDDGSVKVTPLKVTSNLINDVEKLVASQVRYYIDPDQEAVDTPGISIALANGVLSVVDGQRSIVPPSPSVFAMAALPFQYDPRSQCPMWEGFLRRTFEHDPQAVTALQEWFGYFLVGDPGWLQKMFWMIGPKRSGKGTILKVARSLMGVAGTATTLTQLTQDFGREGLIGKSLAVIDDARDPHPNVARQVVEFLLTLSSGGDVSINRKYKPFWDGALTSNLFAASNAVPRLPDAGDAIASRIEVIRTKVSHYGQEDPLLLGRLKTELPGILNWALDGLDRLQANGRFTQALAGDMIRDEVSNGAGSATPLAKEFFMASDQYGTKPSDIKSLIAWWAMNQEDDYRPSGNAIASALKAEFWGARNQQRIVTPAGEKIKAGWSGVVIKCRECGQPATRVSTAAGPECAMHITNTMQAAATEY